jgi:hypothetical protein
MPSNEITFFSGIGSGTSGVKRVSLQCLHGDMTISLFVRFRINGSPDLIPAFFT